MAYPVDSNESEAELALLNHNENDGESTTDNDESSEEGADSSSRNTTPAAPKKTKSNSNSSKQLLLEENEKLKLELENMKMEIEKLRKNKNSNNKKPEQELSSTNTLPTWNSDNGVGEISTLQSIGSAVGSILGRRGGAATPNTTKNSERKKITPAPPSSGTLHHRHNRGSYNENDTKQQQHDEEEALMRNDEFGEKYRPNCSNNTSSNRRAPKGRVDPKALSSISICERISGTAGPEYYDKNSDVNSDDSSPRNISDVEDGDDDDDFVESVPLKDYEEGGHRRSPKKTESGDHDHDGDITHDINNESFQATVKDRASWLVGLLVLQSCSSFILKNNESLLQNHTVIVQFLTMLVGAGGNAGNQASVRVIRGLAVGSLNPRTRPRFLRREALMALCLSTILGVAGLVRAAVFSIPFAETVAITMSLYMIVIISIFLGALLPLGMKTIGIDPAHSSTTIQVVMDILGVTITCFVSSLILGTSIGVKLSKLVGK